MFAGLVCTNPGLRESEGPSADLEVGILPPHSFFPDAIFLAYLGASVGSVADG